MRKGTGSWSQPESNGSFVSSKPVDESRFVGRGVRRPNFRLCR